MKNHLKVINNALGAFAGGTIMAIDEDTALAGKVVPIYFSRLKALLAMHEWSFAGMTFKLDAIAQTDVNGYDSTIQKFNNGWRFAFALPGSRIGDPRKSLRDPRNHRDPLREFLIESGWLYADFDQVWSVCTVMPDPEVWDAQFALAVERIAAADFCVPVTHDAKLAETIRDVAEGPAEAGGRGGLVGRAITSDAAKSRTATPMWRDPLTDARLM